MKLKQLNMHKLYVMFVLCLAPVSRLDVNVARGQPSWSYSVYYNSVLRKSLVSSLAFDGDTSPRYSDGGCMSTNNDNRAWHAVDLGRPSDVGVVAVSNRDDISGECSPVILHFGWLQSNGNAGSRLLLCTARSHTNVLNWLTTQTTTTR